MFECFKKKKVKTKVKDIPTTPEPKVEIGSPEKGNIYPESYLKEALRITGAFEGSGYGEVSGNFDGQGLSIGVLQWNYGQGSIQSKILRPLIGRYGALSIDNCFPSKVSHSAYMSRKEGIAFSKRMQTKTWSWKRRRFIIRMKPEWTNAWRHLLTSSMGREQQLIAADSVAMKAWNYAELYNMKSLKSFCWFFDIVTQNGSLKGIHKPDTDIDDTYKMYLNADGGINKKKWQGIASKEAKTLFIWTCLRVARNKWASDVISRKGTSVTLCTDTLISRLGLLSTAEFNIREMKNDVIKHHRESLNKQKPDTETFKEPNK